MFKSVCPIGTCPGILYGQTKVHKTVMNNIPQFRPILLAINTPVSLIKKLADINLCLTNLANRCLTDTGTNIT